MPNLSAPTRTFRLALVLACFSVLPALYAGAQPQAPADVIAKVKAQVAPDTRLAVFDVKAEVKDGAIEVSGEVDQPAAKDAVLSALRNGGGARVVDKLVVLPDPALGDRVYGFISVSVANQKTKPSHASELGNQLLMGTPVKALKRQGGWVLTQSLDDKYLGYVLGGQLALMTQEEANVFRSTKRAVVTALFAVLREQPGDEAAAVSDVVMGDVLQLKGEAKGWLALQLPDGRTGFLPSTLAASDQEWKASRRAAPENIETVARRMLGVPYVWGGTSPKGMDCSGFTKTVFRANGVELQRDADQQSDQGQPVGTDNDLSALRKGDLLFFASSPGETRITHTGIYLGGKQFIHAASGPGMVRINSFDPASPIYSESLLKCLVKVRRMTV